MTFIILSIFLGFCMGNSPFSTHRCIISVGTNNFRAYRSHVCVRLANFLFTRFRMVLIFSFKFLIDCRLVFKLNIPMISAIKSLVLTALLFFLAFISRDSIQLSILFIFSSGLFSFLARLFYRFKIVLERLLNNNGRVFWHGVFHI